MHHYFYSLFTLQDELLWYGIDWMGPISTDSAEGVTISPCRNPLPPYLYDVLLQHNIDVNHIELHNSDEMYLSTRIFVHSCSMII